MASQAFLSAEAAASSSVNVNVPGNSSSHSHFSIAGAAGGASTSMRGGHHGFVSSSRAAPWEASSERWGHIRVGGHDRACRSGIGAALSMPSFHQHSSSAVFTHDFCGRRSTRQVSKLHFGRPKLHNGKHSTDAECVVHAILRAPSSASIPGILDVWSAKLYPKEDFAYILCELGNSGEALKALSIYEWAITQDSLKSKRGKLLSTTISTLGRLGRVTLAQETFDKAVLAGFGQNVHAFSALVSAYGRSGQLNKALEVFEAMKKSGCRPNLVTYNAVLDACSKGGADYMTALSVFEEMDREDIEPDRITFNSLIAVCSKGGLCAEARKTIEEMQSRGIRPDLVTYNSFLDAVCKAGKMHEAAGLFSSMRRNSVMPNVVTYSTLLDGYSKAGYFTEALAVHEEMKKAHIHPDRVSYNALVGVYAKLGKFDDALLVCTQMERAGYKKDASTYNAVLDAYCKQGKYHDALKLLEKMKTEGIVPNVLTYTPMVDAFLKGGLYKEALQVFKEFREAGLKPDVVLYTSVIDALCKSGLVEDASNLLNQIITEGIQPNVVTFNSMIDAYGLKRLVELPSNGFSGEEIEHLSTLCKLLVGADARHGADGHFNFSRLSLKETLAKKPFFSKLSLRGIHKDILAAVGLFQQMWELGVKPNVVTFSAVLNACSRCASFTEAALLLEELRKFDSKVYGVAHGLLIGLTNQAFRLACVLFDEVSRMDHSTSEAFFNALADILWHFGQRQGAQRVILEARRRHIWVLAWQTSQQQYCLDLHSMSVGAAQAMLHAWLLNIRSIVFEGYELPKLLSILTGWGRHSKVPGESIVKQAVESRLLAIGAPFQVAKFNEGRLVSTGPIVGGWLQETSTLEHLLLHDTRVKTDDAIDWCTEKQLLPA